MIYDNKAYGVTMGIVIWQKEEFKRIFGDGNKTAWEIENHFSKQARHGSGHFIMGYVTDKRLLIPIAHMITKGKWIPSSIEVLEKQGFHIDTQQRGILSQKQVFQMTLRSIGTKICPTYLRHPIKKLLMMCGIKFVTEY